MMKRENFPVAKIYVPIERRKTLVQARVDEIAASMLKDGQQVPIKVRPDGERFVLIEGLHRLEAAKALGEATIVGYRVDARKHLCRCHAGTARRAGPGIQSDWHGVWPWIPGSLAPLAPRNDRSLP